MTARSDIQNAASTTTSKRSNKGGAVSKPNTDTTVTATVTEHRIPKGYFISEYLSKAEVNSWRPAKSGNGFTTQVAFYRADDGKKLWVKFWKASEDEKDFNALPGTQFDKEKKAFGPTEFKGNKLNGSSYFGFKGGEWWTCHNSIVTLARDLVIKHA